MDVNHRQRNRKNTTSGKDESDVISRRPRLSPQSFSAIISHLSINPDVQRRVLAKSDKDSTPKFSKFIESEFKEENCRSSDTMKVEKKLDNLANVSDSFQKTPVCIRRRRPEHALKIESVNLEDIPLPSEKPAKPTNRKHMICTRNATNTKNEDEEDFSCKNSTSTKRNPFPNDLQISLSSDSKECNVSTYPVSSSESCEDSWEESKKFLESPEIRIACQVRNSLYESPPVSHCERNTSKDVAESNSPLSHDSSESESPKSPNLTNRINHSCSEVQFKDIEKKNKLRCFKERTDVGRELVQHINYPSFKTPPPTIQKRQTPPPTIQNWQSPSPTIQNRQSTSVNSREACPPVTENLSRCSDHKAPWRTHSRSGSWHLSKSSSEEEEREISSINIDKMVKWRKLQESFVQQGSSNDTHPSSARTVSHHRGQLRYSPYNNRSTSSRIKLQDTFSRRSYERLPKEFGHEGTMTRASSLDTVWMRSPKTQWQTEPPCFYHLSPHRVHRHALQQRNFGVRDSLQKRDGNSGYSSPISPYRPWTPPRMAFLPPFYLPVQEPDDPLEPNMMGHQLLGDSQLLRFSRQILGKVNRTSYDMRYLGLCVSGQTIQELLQKIKAEFYPVGDKIILMIGTNNFLQNHRIDDIMEAWDELISHLLGVRSRRILLLTVPPIPKLANSEHFWEEWNHINTFIKGYASAGNQGGVTVADISSLFLSGPKQCCVDYFEKTYGDSDRVDMIHINEKGFNLLRDCLTDNDFL